MRRAALPLIMLALSAASILPHPAWSADRKANAEAEPHVDSPSREGDVAAFRRLRTEALAAAGVDDLDRAAALLMQADALIPNHPGMMILQARIDAARGDAAGATRQLQRYADAGLTLDLSRDAALSNLPDTPELREATTRIEANRAPIGADRLSIMAHVQGAGLIEGVARDEAEDSWFISRVAGRDILRLRDGETTPFAGVGSSLEGVMELAFAPETSILWAAVSPAAPATHGRDGTTARAALLALDTSSAQIRTTYPVPVDDGPETRDHGLGNLTLHPDGSVYVSAGMTGAVYRLAAGAEALETFIAPGLLGSPQGMAVAPDAQALIIADYSSGLWRAPVTGDGAPVRMPAPENASLIGLDGVISNGRALYALQSGTSPQRVLKLTLDPEWTRIVMVEVLAANLPEIDGPTTGLVVGNELVFVSRSQWSDFAADGSLRTPDPAPGIIARLRLD